MALESACPDLAAVTSGGPVGGTYYTAVWSTNYTTTASSGPLTSGAAVQRFEDLTGATAVTFAAGVPKASQPASASEL